MKKTGMTRITIIRITDRRVLWNQRFHQTRPHPRSLVLPLTGEVPIMFQNKNSQLLHLLPHGKIRIL